MNDISIRRVSELIKDIEEGTLIVRPYFQRRLVWTNVVKDYFLETVTKGLPFPEIFIATGELDTETMDRKNLLVDGQQRISTLRQYVQGASDLSLTKVIPYARLSNEEKTAFLNYKVAVRDLGSVSEDQIKEIFARINSTDYSLKAMERFNAQFSGKYKLFCDDLSRNDFFDRHRIFSLVDFRRMRDLDFCVILITTILSTYYHRNSLNREYLERYNDDFPQAEMLNRSLTETFSFIDSCGFDKKCRVWKKTDLFTLIIEIHSFHQRDRPLNAEKVGIVLGEFYEQVNEMFAMRAPDDELEKKAPNPNVFRYLKAATKATNDKYARIDRAEVISDLLESTIAKRSRTKRANSKKP